MAKRLFQILDEMNQNDEKNNTATLGVCNSFVGTQKTKQGGTVTMGVPESVVMDLFLGNGKVPILLIVDKAEYDKISKSVQDTSEVTLRRDVDSDLILMTEKKSNS